MKEFELTNRATRHPFFNGLSIVVFISLLLLAFIALGLTAQFGAQAWGSIGISYLLTLGGGVLSFFMVSRYAGQPHVAQVHMFGMLPRMAIALAGLVYFSQVESVWLKTGGPESLILSYLVLLLVESALAIQWLLPASFSEGKSVKV